MSNKIKTKYGNATFDEKRGYRISSKKEGNHKKFVHLLVWEDHYGKIPDNAYVVFKDGDKKNFDISNLKLKYHQKSFETEFGSAIIGNNGYLVVISSKEGNRFKTVHRLMWEKYNDQIPEGYHIHHIDGNRLNNNINNLKLVSNSEHSSLHHKKKNARIIKKGNSRGQVWALIYDGNVVTTSKFYSKLEDMLKDFD